MPKRTDIENLLREHGCRATRPRVAVLRSILEATTLVDAAKLTELARVYEPDIHEATVYRTINVLTEVGLVHHVHVGHGPSLVRLIGDDNLIAKCRDCAQIVTIDEADVSQLISSVFHGSGFILEPGHFALEGICKDCVAET